MALNATYVRQKTCEFTWVDRSLWTASASSNHGSTPIGNGIDGNLETVFASLITTYKDWFRVDMGTVFLVSASQVHFRCMCTYISSFKN